MQLRGTIQRIRYKNETNGYCVATFCDAEGWCTVVGNMPLAKPDKDVILTGEWVTNPKYGDQFRVDIYEEELPTEAAAIEEYLASAYVDGIGPVCARAIVAKFGDATFDIIDNAPDRLLEVDGIGPKRLEQIKAGWEQFTYVRDITLFLQQHDISPAYANRIFAAYDKRAVELISENPYRLADDIMGIGFKKADAIAKTFSIADNSPLRLKSGIIYTLKQASLQGHCFLQKAQLLHYANEILEVPEKEIEKALMDMSDEKVISDAGSNRYYLKSLYIAETGSAKLLKRLINHPVEKVYKVKKSKDIKYNEAQLTAIRSAATSKVSILTGGPGTGKTTAIKGIIKSFWNTKILLAAPTGRAAKRMEEACGYKAQTIHRLLEVNKDGGFIHNENNLLDGTILIVDECSMLDIELFYALLRAVPKDMRLVLVGDVDQLPSVGPGNVLKDIIASGIAPVTRLEFIYRQDKNSPIALNAHKINNGENPELTDDLAEDFAFIEIEDVNKIAEYITDTYAALTRQGVEDVQVLSPMKKGPAGTIAINERIQAKVNPGGEWCCARNGRIKTNDRIMQLKNDYDKGTFNGDIGVVKEIDRVYNEITACIDSRFVPYRMSELDELTLAYATTIHKSQGSEYQVVIMPVTMSHFIMLQRNLIYTAMTRAKSKLIMVGTKKALYTAINDNKIEERNSALAERLKK